MPISIILLLTTALTLTLSMVLGTDWTPETFAAARFALAISTSIVVLWVAVDAIRSLTDKWRRFMSRPDQSIRPPLEPPHMPRPAGTASPCDARPFFRPASRMRGRGCHELSSPISDRSAHATGELRSMAAQVGVSRRACRRSPPPDASSDLGWLPRSQHDGDGQPKSRTHRPPPSCASNAFGLRCRGRRCQSNRAGRDQARRRHASTSSVK